MSYIAYILLSIGYIFSASVGNGGAGWLSGIVGLLAMAIIVAIFLLCLFLLNTKHNVLYAALITIGAVIVAVIFFTVLECFTGPVELPSR